MKKLPITTLIISLAILAVAGVVAYRITPKVSDDSKILSEVKDRIRDKKIDRKDEYIKAIGERIAQLNDANKDNDANALTYMAVFYNNLGEKDLALDYYNRALEKDPRSRIALDNIAHLYEDLSRWDRAEQAYLKLLDTYPNYTLGYRSLAYLYQYHFSDGEQKILKLFEKGLNATNNSTDLLSWLVQYYQDSGRPEKAVPFQQTIANQLNTAKSADSVKSGDKGIKVEVK